MRGDEDWEIIDAVKRLPQPDGDDPEELAQWCEVTSWALSLVYQDGVRNGAPDEEMDEALRHAAVLRDQARRLRRGT